MGIYKMEVGQKGSKAVIFKWGLNYYDGSARIFGESFVYLQR